MRTASRSRERTPGDGRWEHLRRLYNPPELGQIPRNNRQDKAQQMKPRKNLRRDRLHTTAATLQLNTRPDW